MRIVSILACIVTGAAVIGGFYLRRHPDGPRVLYSSVSPDHKWICEIVDVHPSPSICLAVLHLNAYEGTEHLDRGFQGAAYVQDYGNRDPQNISFSWNGDDVTVHNFSDASSLTFHMKMVPNDFGKKIFTSDLVKVERPPVK